MVPTGLLSTSGWWPGGWPGGFCPCCRPLALRGRQRPLISLLPSLDFKPDLSLGSLSAAGHLEKGGPSSLERDRWPADPPWELLERKSEADGALEHGRGDARGSRCPDWLLALPVCGAFTGCCCSLGGRESGLAASPPPRLQTPTPNKEAPCLFRGWGGGHTRLLRLQGADPWLCSPSLSPGSLSLCVRGL